MNYRKKPKQKEIRHEILKFFSESEGEVYNYMMLCTVEKDAPASTIQVYIPDSIYYTALWHYRVPLIMN